MSNFENDNLNNNQNMGNTNFNNQNNPNQNMNFNNNQNGVNDPKIASEINQIKAIKGLILAISIISLIGTICCICWVFVHANISSTLFMDDYDSYIKAKVMDSIFLLIGIPFNITVLTLGIITLVKNSNIRLINISKSLVTTAAILAIVSIIPIVFISLAAFIVSLVCFFNLKKTLNNLNEQNSQIR